MPETVIVDNEYITMKYLPEKNTIYHVVHQPISGQPLRDALSKGFAFLHDHGVSKWVSDDRKNGPMSPEDEQWNREHLSRALIGTEWKYWALVVPEQVVAAGSMTGTINELFEHGLRMMVFVTVEEAFEWVDGFDN